MRHGLVAGQSMLDKQTACEDLKAFERRTTEIIAHLSPTATKWRAILAVTTITTGIGAYHWLQDPRTLDVTFFESLKIHYFFTVSILIFLLLLFSGIHKRVFAPSIIAGRCRVVLNDFSMSCDDSGKLILRPRPSPP